MIQGGILTSTGTTRLNCIQSKLGGAGAFLGPLLQGRCQLPPWLAWTCPCLSSEQPPWPKLGYTAWGQRLGCGRMASFLASTSPGPPSSSLPSTLHPPRTGLAPAELGLCRSGTAQPSVCALGLALLLLSAHQRQRGRKVFSCQHCCRLGNTSSCGHH